MLQVWKDVREWLWKPVLTHVDLYFYYSIA